MRACRGVGEEAEGVDRCFGGVVTDFTQLMRAGLVMAYVSDSRKVSSIAALCEECLVRCHPREAASLQGKIWWASTWSAGRSIVVRACAEGDSDVARVTRVAGVSSRQHTVAQRRRGPPVLVWSDAMYNVNEGGMPEDGGGWLVLARPYGRRGPSM